MTAIIWKKYVFNGGTVICKGMSKIRLSRAVARYGPLLRIETIRSEYSA